MGFQNNFSTFERQTFKAPVADCEWYNLTDDFLDIIKDIQIDIFDISGQKITFKQLRNAADATAKIRNKNFFYKIVHEISQDYLVEGWKIQKNINELINSSQFDFPCIIKSCQGKGGKGNLVCYNQRDFDQVYNIFLSDLFAKAAGSEKEEIATKERWILFDAVDSGLSIDMIFIFKDMLQNAVDYFKKNDYNLFIVVAANSFELAKDMRCIDVITGKQVQFDDYTKYRQFVLESRVKIDNR